MKSFAIRSKKHWCFRRFFDMQKLEWLNQQYLINQSLKINFGKESKSGALTTPLCRSSCHYAYTHQNISANLWSSATFSSSTMFLILKNSYALGSFQRKAALALHAVIMSLDEQEDWGKTGIEKASHDVAEVFGANTKKR